MITTTRPEAYPTTLTETFLIDNEDEIQAAWTMYLDAFGDLAELAMQRHVMHPHEFRDVLTDTRIRKYRVVGPDGQLHGLGAFTNNLPAVPLVSPAFFRRNWPDQFAADQCWHVLFLATSRTGRFTNPAAFRDIIVAMFRQAAGGVVGLDVCTYNAEVRRLPQTVRVLLARTVGPVPAAQVDAQHFWVYDCRGGAV